MSAGAWLLCRIVCDSIESLSYYFDATVRVNVGPWRHGPDVKVWRSATAVHVDLYQEPASVHLSALLVDTTGEHADRVIASSIDRWKKAAA